MAFKVGRETLIPISNVSSPAKEQELKNHDTKAKDGVLDLEEASSFLRAKDGSQALNIGDVYSKVGGRQHSFKLLSTNYFHTIDDALPGASHKGDFHINGVGAGNVRTGRVMEGGVDALHFAVNCDLMDKTFLEEKIDSVNILIGPKGFNPESGSTLGEQIAIPLNIATRDASSYQTYSRGGGGGSVNIPEKKMLGARVDVASLAALAGNSGGLSFYIRIDTVDGKTHYINKDGMPGSNFDLDAQELAPRGNP